MGVVGVVVVAVVVVVVVVVAVVVVVVAAGVGVAGVVVFAIVRRMASFLVTNLRLFQFLGIPQTMPGKKHRKIDKYISYEY